MFKTLIITNDIKINVWKYFIRKYEFKKIAESEYKFKE